MALACLQDHGLIGTLILQDAEAFILPTNFEEGKEKCPYDPARGFTGLIIGEQTLLPPVLTHKNAMI